MKRVKKRKPIVEKNNWSKCRHCGHSIDKDSTFCKHCGAKHATIHSAHGKRCPKCGVRLEETATYCKHCGVHLDHYTGKKIIKTLIYVIMLLVFILIIFVTFNLINSQDLGNGNGDDLGLDIT